MDFLGRLDFMLKREGISDASLAKMLGKRSSLISNWRNRAKENEDFIPASDVIKNLSESLHVSSGYFFGLEDEYGLDNSDWYIIASLISSWLGAINRDFEWVFAEAGIEDVDIESFENGLSPLKAEQLEKIGEVCRIPDIKVYLPIVYSAKLWLEMQKTAPDDGDGLNDAQMYFVKQTDGLTLEESVAAVAYIQGLRDKG